eukprot:PITA_05880
MVEEYDSIMKNNVWEVVSRPDNKSVVGSKWIYKVNHAPRAWYTQIDTYLRGLSFTKTEADVNLYHIVVDANLLILVLYVDDLILTGYEKLICSFKEDLAREFEMKDMGFMHYFLGLQVWHGDGQLFVSQGKYSSEVLQIFHMDKCKPKDTPLTTNWRKESSSSREAVDATVFRQLVGSLMYMVNTRPDICYVVNQLSQVMVKPTKLYWKATKYVSRYLRGITKYGLWYRRIEGVKLRGFTNVDWVGTLLYKKSTSGAIFSVGSAVISWYSRQHKFLALSTIEVEYMAASQETCETIWMRKVLVGNFSLEMDLVSVGIFIPPSEIKSSCCIAY